MGGVAMITLKVNGMSCDHCVRSVWQALEEVPGVEQVMSVKLDSGEAVVKGSPDAQRLIAAVEEEGYHAKVLE